MAKGIVIGFIAALGLAAAGWFFLRPAAEAMSIERQYDDTMAIGSGVNQRCELARQAEIAWASAGFDGKADDWRVRRLSDCLRANAISVRQGY